MSDLSAAFAAFPELTTERLRLRAVEPGDAAVFFQLLADPSVVRYLGRAPMRRLEDAEHRVGVYRQTFAEQTGIVWTMVARATGDVVGNILLWKLDRDHFRAELGYILAPALWGRGLVTEAATVVLDHAFGPLGLHSVAAQLDPDNAASRRVLEKLGFVQEAHYREDFFHPVEQRFTDTAVYSLLAPAWHARRAGNP